MSPKVALQYLLPHRLLTRLAYGVARVRVGWFKDWLIRLVIRRFGVDMTEAANPDPRSYLHFNAFFTRELKPGARRPDPDPSTLLMPADGKVSQVGRIAGGRIFQAKGRDYSAAELLGSEAMAAPYADGWFANVYLSPRDYHRVHMPWDGELQETLHVPGRLFTVAPWGVRAIPRLFARNERLVCHFGTEFGPMCVVMVGALLVSGVETVWNGEEIPPYAHRPVRRDWRGQGIRLARFAEMARFNYGSTVILLFPRGAVELDGFDSEAPTRVGQRLGQVLPRG
ncbi:archaetidylserine decarboxylase [Arenimonas fontis]|uniref:Phosphatidylserine decarboxylase proenzyme n=1 Tax=Arenimonas fontis TaxID=2608255 RepID=A0A5B2ZF93_9GAMM|nr:archaetidylserine decarboxylase [Arenimonas fontis]KAA2286213.1 phosphatidylserine decarboxylase [Arenimonas fontis]